MVSNLYRQGIFFAALLIASFALTACGNGGGASDELAIALVLPEGEFPELFWYGVEKKSLSLAREGKVEKEWFWAGGARVDQELRKGDLLRFQGADREGRVLVEGVAEVSGEKKISIPLRRVL